jgi:hypothetical protein
VDLEANSKVGFWGLFLQINPKVGSAKVADSMAENFKVTWLTS